MGLAGHHLGGTLNKLMDTGLEIFKSKTIGKFVVGFDIDLREWGLGITYSFGSSGFKSYLGVQILCLGLFIGVDR